MIFRKCVTPKIRCCPKNNAEFFRKKNDKVLGGHNQIIYFCRQIQNSTFMELFDIKSFFQTNNSATELQRRLEHMRYQSFGEMMCILRLIMGKRDDKYILKGNIEQDEGFFSNEVPDSKKEEKIKAGTGSQKKNRMLVIAESTKAESPKHGQKPKYEHRKNTMNVA